MGSGGGSGGMKMLLSHLGSGRSRGCWEVSLVLGYKVLTLILSFCLQPARRGAQYRSVPCEPPSGAWVAWKRTSLGRKPAVGDPGGPPSPPYPSLPSSRDGEDPVWVSQKAGAGTGRSLGALSRKGPPRVLGSLPSLARCPGLLTARVV